ncbi:MAG TPA: TIGR01212 family radical SAM protein [Thermotogota bacterium]|nr:TIGR01212 family radical SAM protein [Thermotogota bacterium]HPH10254.1 TIGR01212 family radical SAM protein [Thermotogota bacterium]HPM20401.1 TIGR01212 family radical SAM protein [Thermotogota bacterium]HQN22398.1 TIGR01212 family radical SAM protein [Thermotogota bacterium]
MTLYKKLNTVLKEKYGRRVQRLSISLGLGCPNRDGTIGTGGCIFCDPTGSGFAAMSPEHSVEEQILSLREKMMRKYRSPLFFIAYFQSFSNTYAPIPVLKSFYDRILPFRDIVALDVSTRPDLVCDEVLELLASYRDEREVFLELGLQSVNTETLRILNRGHTLEEWIDGAERAKQKGLSVIAHMILDLPWDSEQDIVAAAQTLNRVGISGVKCHSLYVVAGTVLAKMVETGDVRLLPPEAYIQRLILFLEHLNPEIVIHRLVSDAPKTGVLQKVDRPKSLLIREIEEEMAKRDTWQGKRCRAIL